MKKNYKITPEGTKDFLFEECVSIRKVEKTLEKIFFSKGYHQVMTPGLEFFDAFNRGSSGIQQEDMYILTDRKGRLMVMRPDLTLPIARMVSTRLQDERNPLRLYYNQTVYRNLPGLTGRSSEIRQAGIELLGSGGKRADLEIITTAIDVLKNILPDFRIEIGHAGFYRCLADKLDVDKTIKEEIRIFIESKNFSALNSILDSLEQTDAVQTIRKLPRFFGGEEVFEKAASLSIGKEAENYLSYIKELYNDLSKYMDRDKIMIDLGLVQRNDYYSDIVFSGYVEGSGDAVLVGGRYDGLMDAFDHSMPAAGFGVNVDVLADFITSEISAPEVLVHADSGYEIEAMEYEKSLILNNKSCENSVFLSREEALIYAKERKIKKVIFIAEEIEEKSL